MKSHAIFKLQISNFKLHLCFVLLFQRRGRSRLDKFIAQFARIQADEKTSTHQELMSLQRLIHEYNMRIIKSFSIKRVKMELYEEILFFYLKSCIIYIFLSLFLSIFLSLSLSLSKFPSVFRQ